MPSSFYHIKFELYPSAHPTDHLASTTTSTSRFGEVAASYNDHAIWVPPAGTDVFEQVPPQHTTTNGQTAAHLPRFHPLFDTRTSLPLHPRSYHGPETNRDDRTGKNVAGCELAQGTTRPVQTPNISLPGQRPWTSRTQSFPPPPASAALRPDTAAQDWRFGRVSIQSLDLTSDQQSWIEQEGEGKEEEEEDIYSAGDNMTSGGQASTDTRKAGKGIGPTFNQAGTSTQAEYRPCLVKNTEIGWGVVHFYREGLDSTDSSSRQTVTDQQQDGYDKASTTLCIPALPTYMTPRDFLAFMGHEWQEGISHIRIVSTAQMSRNLVLLKFSTAKRASEWQGKFNGTVHEDTGDMIQVVFVKSITFDTPARPSGDFPDLSRDPFTPSPAAPSGVSNSLKPFPPPTPDLIELPTCAVCLERMDDTTGLMTIACQHVFHCKCLESWKGGGCPICRYTSEKAGGEQQGDPSNPYTQPFGSGISNLCSVCDCPDDLWICLICGRVGCGRYKNAHAKDHWKDSAHSFALELETQHVWDYAGDTWVHRLIRDKGDGKVVELPGATERRGPNPGEGEGLAAAAGGIRAGGSAGTALPDDVVPRAKLDNIGHEYTHLITSQLESQRVYFEEMINKIADKASHATATAESATRQVDALRAENETLRSELRQLKEEAIPQLERDAAREAKKAEKAQELARGLGKAVQEEKAISKGLMKRLEHDKAEVEGLRASQEEYKGKVAELEEMNRDLSMFISGQEKLKALEEEGKVEKGEIEEGSASVPEKKGKRRGKK